MQEAINGWVCSQDIWVCFVSGLCGGELCRSARPAAASAMQAAPSEGIAGAEGSAAASFTACRSGRGCSRQGQGRCVGLGWRDRCDVRAAFVHSGCLQQRELVIRGLW